MAGHAIVSSSGYCCNQFLCQIIMVVLLSLTMKASIFVQATTETVPKSVSIPLEVISAHASMDMF